MTSTSTSIPSTSPAACPKTRSATTSTTTSTARSTRASASAKPARPASAPAATKAFVCGPDGGTICDALPWRPQRETCNGCDDDCDGITDEDTPVIPITCGEGACAAEGVIRCIDGCLIEQCEPGAPPPSSATATTTTATARPTKASSPAPPSADRASARPRRAHLRRRPPRRLLHPGAPAPSSATRSTTTATARATKASTPSPPPAAGACAAEGEIVCVDGDEVDTCLPEPPADEICNGVDDDCDGEVDEGEAVFAANEYAAAGHAIVMGDFGLAGSTRMHLRDDARLVVRSDGSARLTGTAHIVAGPNPAGQEWAVDVTFAYRGQGPAFGGPKIENPPLQPRAVTDEWHYYDMTAGTLTRPGSHVTLTQMPADGRFPMQLGIAANGKDGDLGLSLWFTWVRRDANGTGCDGHGDFNLDLEPIDTEGCVPQDEICDGIDNDLDGETDEGFGVGDRCQAGVGACAAEGSIVCLDGAAVCDAAVGEPARELCNGADDDCDGVTDEGIAPQPSRCGQGACEAEGVITCEGGRFVDSCDPGDPRGEQCNGEDDDCDGATDEGIAPQPSHCGVGACGNDGQITCQGGRLVDTCEPGAPGAERCNGADDDCDGATDEGIAPQPSRCGQGACEAEGVITCAGGRFVDSCDPGDPRGEQCNGEDDDCDGATDEGIAPSPPTAARAVRGDGEVICQGGRLVDTCDPGEPGAEVCNAFDDDCDGTADEGIDPTPSECGEGICAARGEIVCVDGDEVDTCLPEPPADEICNGVDDDCDGEVDEGEAVFAANEYAAAGHAIVMGDFGLAGSTRMHLRDDARLVVRATAARASPAPRTSSPAPTPPARSGRSTSPSPTAARAPRSADPRSRTPRSSRAPSPTSGTTTT
ncbi:MAG: hypothetical protein H6701_13460 [Myxococcales bacterium]|nr:hypothetical protein [Myxococcales bacterium]